MIDALEAAGFVGIEPEGTVIYARMPQSGAEVSFTCEGDRWLAALSWPVRGSTAQITMWNAQHPGLTMDIHQGETRVTMLIGPADLAKWAAGAEEAVVACIRWRREQRAPGEGM